MQQREFGRVADFLRAAVEGVRIVGLEILDTKYICLLC